MAQLMIDPGTRRTGFAKFCGGKDGVYFAKCGLIKAPRDLNWIDRSDFMVQQIRDLVAKNNGKDKWQITRVVIEMPQSYSGGRGEAARNSGSIPKLTFLIGMIRHALLTRGIDCTLLPVRLWRAQTPDVVIAKRLRKHWGYECDEWNFKPGSDPVDAVGIGDYWFRKKLKWKVVRR